MTIPHVVAAISCIVYVVCIYLLLGVGEVKKDEK